MGSDVIGSGLGKGGRGHWTECILSNLLASTWGVKFLADTHLGGIGPDGRGPNKKEREGPYPE